MNAYYIQYMLCIVLFSTVEQSLTQILWENIESMKVHLRQACCVSGRHPLCLQYIYTRMPLSFRLLPRLSPSPVFNPPCELSSLKTKLFVLLYTFLTATRAHDFILLVYFVCFSSLFRTRCICLERLPRKLQSVHWWNWTQPMFSPLRSSESKCSEVVGQ